MSRLKSLELHGYKTFASKTVFEFAEEITAIVGPNGSGKSNIADALRWVLGEQSYSLLRGRKTEDMIFAGSEQRSRAGMASATVVFDNSDSWLPIDFSEVAITRRAFRDGDNEYLLNGQRVRLRDVSELLAQSGLAERTYTIIGQGLVDAALALKAEERRRLFEEAAGIGLHRTRREEALRRLDATRRNLDRVQDILAEIQPRLRSLERQARRAQEYDRFKSELQVLLREWYGFHWHQIQMEMAEAHEAARRQEQALEKARSKQEECDRQLQASRLRIQELREKLNEWHNRSARLHAQREATSRDLAISGERIHSLENQAQNTTQELERTGQEIAMNQSRLDELDQVASGLKDEILEARGQAKSAREAYQSALVERQAVEKAIQAARKQVEGLTSQLSEINAQLVENRNQIVRQTARQTEANTALEIARGAIRKFEEQVSARNAEANQSARERAGKESDYQSFQEKLSSSDAALKSSRDTRSQIQSRAARLSAQMDVHLQAESSLAGYSNGAQVLLKAAQQGRLNCTQGVLSGNLEVPAEFESAIVAVLGEYIDAILFAKEEETEEALRILEGDSARAALISIDAAERPEETSTQIFETPPEGFLGIASDFVTVSPELQKIVNMLLGRVIVVRDRSCARKMLEKIRSERTHQMYQDGVRIVTLKGEVFSNFGFILAGQEGKPTTIRWQREKREIQQQLEHVQQELVETGEKITAQERGINELREQEEILRRDLQSARQRETSAASAYSQAEMELERARQQVRWQEEQSAHFTAEITQREYQSAELKKRLSTLEADLAGSRKLYQERLAASDSTSTQELQAQIAHWDSRIASVERLESENQKSRQAYLSAAGRMAQTIKELTNRKAEIEKLRIELEVRRQDLLKTELDIHSQIGEIGKEIDPFEVELQKSEMDQARLQSKEGEARQSLNQAEHFHAQAKINLARKQEAVESLRHRIEDDFGLVAFEYVDEVTGPTPLPLGEMVAELPKVKSLSADIEESMRRLRAQLRRMGPVNPEAQAEYREVKDRYHFLTEQVTDLNKAELDLRQVITELDDLMKREFHKTFSAVAVEFRQIFNQLFNGGSARLVLTDPEDLSLTGIDIEARLPGRREQGLSLLSGGERSLTAIALVFALLRVSPTPFCVLDEVDAMLDEANVGRFRELLSELSQTTQFAIITHNRNTVEAAQVIYGVTMGRDSTSQVISLKIDEVDERFQNHLSQK